MDSFNQEGGEKKTITEVKIFPIVSRAGLTKFAQITFTYEKITISEGKSLLL